LNDVQVLEIVYGALNMAARLAGPLLASSLVIGIIVSIIQTVTSVQEQSLTFVPKLIASGVILLFAGNWMIQELVAWVRTLWGGIGAL
jgi:flagellar biosynthesis protein FliQ